MRSNSAMIYRVVLILGDWLALTAAFSVAYILRVKFDDRSLVAQIPAETFLYAILAVLPLWILVHGAIGLYSKHVFENRFVEFGRLFLGSFIGVLVVIGYDFVIEDTIFPARLVVVYGFLLGLGFLVLFRAIARMMRGVLFNYGIGVTNLLVVGNGTASDDVISQFLDTKSTGYRIVGTVDREKTSNDIPNFKSVSEAVKNLGKDNVAINSIIQAELYKDDRKNSDIIAFAQNNHLDFRFIPGTSGLYSGNIAVELVREIPMLSVHQTALTGWGRIIKRLFDLSFGVVAVIVLSPFLLLAALIQKIVEPGAPVLFKQTRLTQFNREFTCYKFRTLKQKYNGLLPEEGFTKMGKPELAKQFRKNGDFLANDPRLTGLGRLLRKTSLDELPQLLNVVKGDISLVGPRALVPRDLDAYEKKHAILSVKSGMTGLAQVSGRKDISYDERRKLDVYYVQNWSFWGDIVIILKTLRTVITPNSN